MKFCHKDIHIEGPQEILHSLFVMANVLKGLLAYKGLQNETSHATESYRKSEW